MKPTTDFPFLLDNPRAWRTYLGGRMLDALHGDSNGEDGHFPEEWILSTVAARNAGREQFPEEGMSHLRGTDVTLKSVLESDTEGYLGKGAVQPTLGVLTKLIDSAERLTLQVHPDRPTALRLFQSQYGKTECWHILSGHPVNGEEPCIYYGFQPGLFSERSMSARKFFLRRSHRAEAVSATPSLCWAMGTTMTWMGATAGGSTRPLLSPWVIIMAPMMRVDIPQLVW